MEEETQYLRAKGCGYRVPVGDEELLKMHEVVCPQCNDPDAVRRRLKAERAKRKNQIE